jgi:hypothetical protein
MNVLGMIYQQELAALRETVKKCDEKRPVQDERERWESFNQN